MFQVLNYTDPFNIVLILHFQSKTDFCCMSVSTLAEKQRIILLKIHIIHIILARSKSKPYISL